MLHTLTVANFRPYGRIIGYPGKQNKGKVRNLFRIILTEKAKLGWRIAYLIVRDKHIRRLECHPFSFESFEPVRGKSILFVTRRKDARTIKCFSLDQPVVLNKGIWHGVVTLTPETEIKLTENAKVKCVYWDLEFKLSRAGIEGKEQHVH